MKVNLIDFLQESLYNIHNNKGPQHIKKVQTWR